METGLSETRRKILLWLAEKDRTWKELKSLTQLSDPVLARHLKELEEKGYIESVIDKRDRRVKIYTLSKEGREATKGDLLAVFLTFVLKERIGRYLKPEYLQKYPTKEELEKIVDSMCGEVGRLYFASILEGVECVKAFTKALELYSKIETASPIVELFVEEERKLLKTRENEDFLEIVVGMIAHDILVLKNIEERDAPEEVKKRAKEKLNDYINTLRGLGPIFRLLIDTLDEELKEKV
jgi:DNA-binding MarR family transcriptional regulator